MTSRDSPQRGFVDHAQYDTTAILTLIEERWNLALVGRSVVEIGGAPPLAERDAHSGALLTAFDFTQS
jgi:hypothetical protein